MTEKIMITGDCGYGLIEHVLSLIEKHMAGSPDKLIVVAPDFDLLESMKVSLLNRGVVNGIHDEYFTTLRGLVQTVNRDLKIISKSYARMVLKDVLSRDSLNLQRESYMPGFRRRVESLFDEILAHNLSGRERLFDELKSRDDFPVSGLFIGKLINAFYEYEREVATLGFSFLESTLQNLKSLNLSALNGSTVIITGFESFSSGQIEFIKALGHVTEKAIITLPSKPEQITDKYKPLIESGFIENRIDCGNLATSPEILTFENVSAEVEYIARRCSSLIENGVNPDNILIVSPAAYNEYQRFVTTFRKSGIPLKVTVPVHLGEISPVRDIMAILNLLDSDLERGLSVISSRYADTVAKFVESLPARDLKKFLMGEDIDIAENKATSDKLKKLLDSASGVKDFKGFKSLIDKVIDTFLRLPDRIPYDPNKLASESIRTFRNILAEMERFHQSEDLSVHPERAYTGFLAELSEQVGNSLIRSRDRRRNVVELTDIPHAVNKRAGYVFLCSMSDNRFPKITPADPIIGELSREELRGIGFEIQTAGSSLETEMNRLDLVLATASENLVITSPRTDNRGEEILVSSAITDKFPEIEPISATQSDPGFFTWDDLILDVMSEKSDSDLAKQLKENLKTQYPRGLRALKGKNPVNYEMDSDCLSESGIIGSQYSASGLERYETCPFIYFCEHILKIPGAQISTEKIFTALIRGIAIHNYLSEKIAGKPQSVDFTAILDDLGCEVSEMDFSEESVLNDYLHMTEQFIAFEIDRLKNLSRTVDSSEYPFGMENNPPLEIETDSGSRKFRGRIDRIDKLADNSYVLIDYKTSSRDVRQLFKDAKIYQLPLYALAAYALGMDISDLEIISISRKGYSSCSLSQLNGGREEIRIIADDGKSRILDLVKRIETGIFHASPSDRGSCGYDKCGFYHVCRIE